MSPTTQDIAHTAYRNVPKHALEEKSPTKSPATKAMIIALEILLTIIVVGALFLVYIVSISRMQADYAQGNLVDKVHEKWGTHAPHGAVPSGTTDTEIINFATAGEPVAIMKIPRLWGDNRGFAVVKGTQISDIANAPGWYEETQMPGEKGNFAVAGHEYGYNAPFEEVWYHMNTCDNIEVETATKNYTYLTLPRDASEVEKNKFRDCAPKEVYDKWEKSYAHLNPNPVYGVDTVDPSQGSVLRPVPLHETEEVSEEDKLALVTLQTCYPHLGNSQRAVVRGALIGEQEKEIAGKK